MRKIRTRFYCGLVEKDGTPITKNVYLEVMNRHFTGYTIFPATGYWQGEPEPCVVFEIIAGVFDLPKFQVAEELCEIGNQTAVLTTEEEITGEFISARKDA